MDSLRKLLADNKRCPKMKTLCETFVKQLRETTLGKKEIVLDT